MTSDISETAVSCNLSWPVSIRHKLRVVSLYTGKSMSKLSAMAVDALFTAFEEIRTSERRNIPINVLTEMIAQALRDNPDLINDVLKITAPNE